MIGTAIHAMPDCVTYSSSCRLHLIACDYGLAPDDLLWDHIALGVGYLIGDFAKLP